MKNFWKTWWHCLLRPFSLKHRMCWLRPAGVRTRTWFCECEMEKYISVDYGFDVEIHGS